MVTAVTCNHFQGAMLPDPIAPSNEENNGNICTSRRKSVSLQANDERSNA